LIGESGSLAFSGLVNLFFIPPILLQKDFLLFASFEPAFSLDGSFVTAVFNFEPGLDRKSVV
jgi:hypothetical protein